MSAKFIVQKFEPGFNLKTLQITIENEDSNAPGVKFSEWYEGTVRKKRKHKVKSARLVVKLAADHEASCFDLDACAQQVDDHSPNYYNLLESHNYVEKNLKNIYENSKAQPSNPKPDHKIRTIKILAKNKVAPAPVNSDTSSSPRDSLSPLEYSLEKVKENNARIMENIQMLNRTLSYTKRKELQIVSPKALRSHPCQMCGKCFVYVTGLKRHCQLRHGAAAAGAGGVGGAGAAPRWQVVWTCAECYTVWPRAAAAAEHASHCGNPDRADSTREIKTSLLLQCEFCEKMFTSIPRMLRHTKLHSTTNNYECSACQLGFRSYRAAEQHWLACPWQEANCFALPKLLLCNACDRKFRNYEQLYNHRYKLGHFLTKVHGSLASAPGSLSYQCELCAQCHPSIAALTVHRNQCHLRYEQMNYYGP